MQFLQGVVLKFADDNFVVCFLVVKELRRQGSGAISTRGNCGRVVRAARL